MAVAKKEVDIGELELIRKIILTKLTSIKRKRFEEKSIDRFSLAFRVFLLKFLHLDYEFTEQELSKELEKRRVNNELKEGIMRIANLLAEIKYEGKKVTKIEFNAMLDEGIKIIMAATHKVDEKIEKEHEQKKERQRLIEESKKKLRDGLFKIVHSMDGVSNRLKGAARGWKKRIIEQGRKKKLKRKELERIRLEEKEKRKIKVIQEEREALKRKREEESRNLRATEQQKKERQRLIEESKKKFRNNYIKILHSMGASRNKLKNAIKEWKIKTIEQRNKSELERKELERVRLEEKEKRKIKVIQEEREALKIKREEELKNLKVTEQQKKERQRLIEESKKRIRDNYIKIKKALPGSCHHLMVKIRILRANKALGKNRISRAKSLYTRAINSYTKLKQKEKKEVYPILLKLYNDISSQVINHNREVKNERTRQKHNS